MKYTLRKIFIGVSIGFILMCLKSCNVYAATSYSYLYKATSVVGDMSFDACLENGDNLTCIDAFNYSGNIKYSDGSRIFTNTDKLITLKSFSLNAIFNESNAPTIYQYGSLSDSLSSFFLSTNILNGRNNSFLLNESLSYVTLITQDDISCVGFPVGSTFGSTKYRPFGYFQVPTECRNKQLKEINLVFQSGYNYVGSNSILNPIETNSSYKVDDYITKYKNDTYLLSWKNKNVFIANDLGNVQLYFSSSNEGAYGSSYRNNTYSNASVQLNENLANLQKEQDLVSSWVNSDIWQTQDWTSTQNSEMEETFGNVSTGLTSALDDFAFNDFLSALTQYPIEKMLWITRDDNIAAEGDMQVIKCPTIYLPFKVNLQTAESTYGMNLPCMSSIYESIPFVGGGTGQTNPWNFNLIVLWHIILHGYLTYLLILTWLNLIKYSVTRSSSEIEVLEL